MYSKRISAAGEFVDMEIGDVIFDPLDFLYPVGHVIGLNPRFATISWGSFCSIVQRNLLPPEWRLEKSANPYRRVAVSSR